VPSTETSVQPQSRRPIWFWLAASAAAIATSFVWIAAREAPLYVSHSTIELQAPEASLAAQRRVLESDSMILKAATKAGIAPFEGTLLATARKRLTIQSGASPRVIQISSTAPYPEDAARLANALVDTFASEAQAHDAASAAERKAKLETLHSEMEDAEMRLLNFQTDHEGSSKSERKQLYRILTDEMATLQESYDKMLSDEVPASVPKVVERAQVPAQSINVNPWWDLGFGGALVLLGGSVFFFSRRRAQSFDAPPVVQQQEAPPVECAPPAPAQSRIVAVSNVGAGLASPETLLDYVETLLGSGETVLIVDCEATGAFTESVGLTGGAGLSDFLFEGGADSCRQSAIWKSNWDGIAIMPVGTAPSKIAALLARPEAGESLASLGREYGRVVINAPSILTAGEMRDLTPQIDGIVLVAPAERSTGLAHSAVRQVEEYGGRVVGWVEDAANARPELAVAA